MSLVTASVLVSACHGVDVTPEKLSKKFAEVYMALDIVLRGVTSVRLSAMLSSIHGESLAKLVHSGIDFEGKIRGADSWSQLQHLSLDHSSGVSALSYAQFEIPLETLKAGDLYAVSIAPASTSADKEIKGESSKNEEEEVAPKDPFAASDNLNKPQELVAAIDNLKAKQSVFDVGKGWKKTRKRDRREQKMT